MRTINGLFLFGLLAGACTDSNGQAPASPTPRTSNPAPTIDLKLVEVRTTSERIAFANLDGSIQAFEERLAERPERVDVARSLVDHQLTRGRFLGRYSDYDRALSVLGAFPGSLSLRAQVESTRHLFREALQTLEANDQATLADKAVVLTALGRAAEVADQMVTEADQRPSYRNHLLAANALSSLGRFDEADDQFVRALEVYRDASPFPVAAAYFQRGVMWAEVAGFGDRGRVMYERALAALPSYITANVHLAEMEWEEGDVDGATARLEAILDKTEDPEPFGLLGEIMLDAGREAEGRAHIAEANRRYQSLLQRHPAAFWDHASEFYSGPGEDAALALSLAEKNLENRPTERAHLLVVNSALAGGDTARACEIRSMLDGRSLANVELAETLTSLACP